MTGCGPTRQLVLCSTKKKACARERMPFHYSTNVKNVVSNSIVSVRPSVSKSCRESVDFINAFAAAPLSIV